MTDLATNPQGAADARVLGAEGVDALQGADDFDLHAADEALDDQDSPEDGEEEFEDIEHDGRRHRVPKALKDAFLRHADYTRKTQELAEQRRALETHVAQQAHAQQAHLADLARLVALNDQVQTLEQIDWPALEREDPARAQSLWRQYSQLKDGRDDLIGRVGWMDEQRALEAQRQAARRVEDGHAVLARDIRDWSPEVANRLSDFGRREFGFSEQELASVDDPRMIKVLHLAFVGDQTLKKQAAASRLAQNQAARPASQVGANSPAGKNPDRMSIDDWMSFERERLRKASRR